MCAWMTSERRGQAGALETEKELAIVGRKREPWLLLFDDDVVLLGDLVKERKVMDSE